MPKMIAGATLTCSNVCSGCSTSESAPTGIATGVDRRRWSPPGAVHTGPRPCDRLGRQPRLGACRNIPAVGVTPDSADIIAHRPASDSKRPSKAAPLLGTSAYRHTLHTGSSKDVEVVTRQDVTFIQVPDFLEQHLFGVRNSSSATGIPPVIDHQQSRLHTVCKVSKLSR
jgi:hypothetical protein